MKDLDKYINKYIDSIYNNVNNDSKEVLKIKNDMKLHLEETIKELKDEGYSEEESIKIAFDRFGDRKSIKKEVEDMFPKGLRILRFALIISILLSIFSIGYIIIFKDELDYIKSPIMIFLIPIYLLIRNLKITREIKNDLHINFSMELYKFIFLAYIMFIVSRVVFPIDFSRDNMLSFNFKLIPFTDIIDSIPISNYYGIPVYQKVIGFLKMFIFLIPVGILAPIVMKKIKGIKQCILLGIILYSLPIVSQIILYIFGLSNRIIYISFDVFMLNTLGICFGFLLYKRIFKQSNIDLAK